MKIVTCNVIEDLLPLYAEEMLSADSKQLVEDHLGGCADCQLYLRELQKIEALPIETDTQPLQKIRQTIQNKKRHAIILTAFMTLFIGTLTVIFMTTPKYFPYAQDIINVSETENGLTVMDFNESVTGYDWQEYPAENGPGMIYHVTTWSTTWDDLVNTEGMAPVVLSSEGEDVAAIYYYQTNGSADQLLYGSEQYPNGGAVTLPRLSLNYLFGLAVVGLVISSGMLYAVRANGVYFKRMMKITLLPLAYVVAHLFVTGWNAMTYSPVRDLAAILLVATLIYGGLWIGIKLIKKQADK